MAAADARFWARVEKTPTCWLWTGPAEVQGRYGRFQANNVRWLVHRFAFFRANPAADQSLDVCHNCPGGENTLCVNPTHLFVGTHTDNMTDMARKGRANKKLTHAQVTEIRWLRTWGNTHKSIATEFGVKRETVRDICKRRTRRYLP